MNAYFYDTESKKRYNIQYIDTRVNNGSFVASYQAANIPQSSDNKLFWIKSERSGKSITLYLDGDKILADIDVLKSFCFPAKGKKAPPIVQFQLANLPVVDVVITNVSSEIDLNYLVKEKITRCQVTIQFMEIDK